MPIDIQPQLERSKDDVLDLLKKALRSAGIDLDITSIHLRAAKRGPLCPPGQTAVWEAVTHPDGSVSYHWVCR